MFKHNASSIKENSTKQFVSQTERNQWDTKSEKEHNHDKDYYTKSDMSQKIYRGAIKVKDAIATLQSNAGDIRNIEIFGNSLQPTEGDYTDIRHVGEVLENGKVRLKLISTNFNICDQSKLVPNTALNTKGEIVSCSNGDRTTPFLRIRPNTKYLIKSTYLVSENVGMYGHVYDINKKSLGSIQFEKPGTAVCAPNVIYSTPANAQYMVIRLNSADKCKDLMVAEIDDENHIFVPHESDSTEITLPCHLEGIKCNRYGTFVGDRLFKDTDGKYKIEKAIKKYVFTDKDVPNFGSFEDKEDCFKVGISFAQPFGKMHNIVLCNRFIQGTTVREDECRKTQVAMYKHRTSTEFRFAFKKSEYPELTDMESIRQHLRKLINDEKGLYVLYATARPEIIELPIGTDLQLKAFEGVTNVFSDSLTPHQIQCEVPASVTSSIAGINSEIDRQMEAVSQIEGMKESQTLVYETDKGLVNLHASNNGYIDDVYIQGKTVYNLLNRENIITQDHTFTDSNKIRLNASQDVRFVNFFTSREQFKPDTTYTIFCNVYANTLELDPQKGTHSDLETGIVFRVTDGHEKTVFPVKSEHKLPHYIFGYKAGELGEKKIVIKTLPEAEFNASDKMCGIRSWVSSIAKYGGFVVFDIVILEGDHSDTEITDYGYRYKQALNVGMGSNSATLRTTGGVNLLPLHQKPDIIQGYDCLTVNEDNSLTFKNTTGEDSKYAVVGAKYFIKVKKNTSYTFKLYDYTNKVNYCVGGYSLNGAKEQYISTRSGRDTAVFNTGNCTELAIRFTSEKQASLADSTFRALLVETKNIDLYRQELQSDSVKLQSLNGESIQLRSVDTVYDTIEKINGVYKHVQRCEQERFDGASNENWFCVNLNELQNVYGFGINLKKLAYNLNNTQLLHLTCNRFGKLATTDSEGVRIGNFGTSVFVFIAKSKIAEHTVAEFKNWLVKNPLVVTYEIEIPEYNDIKDFSIKTFNQPTTVSLTSSCITPDVMRFKAPGYIGTTINTLRDKIKLLERRMETIRKAALISTLNDVNNHYKIEQISKF